MRERPNDFTRMILKARRDSWGITGLEIAIVLIAFVVVSSVFAFAALSTGLFSSDKSKETIIAGLSEARGTLELRGAVIGKESGTTGDIIDEISFQVANSAGGESVDLTPGKTLVIYSDVNQAHTFTGSNITVTALGLADTDKLVEPGEMYEIKLTGLGAKLTTNLSTGAKFTVEVKPPQGAVLNIERTIPVVIDPYVDLG